MINNKSTFIVFSLLVLVLISCSSDSATLKITPGKADFGSVFIGDDATIDLVFKNKYGKAIVISTLTITGTGDFSIIGGGALPINLDKNDEHTLTINFEPTFDGAHEGLFSIIHDGSSKAKEVDLMGVGVTCARIVLSENSFDFQKKLINKTHTHDFTVDNIGTADLVISSLTFSGTGAVVYSASTTPLTITPGNSDTVTVTFSPSVIGNYVADLSISHNAVNENSPLIYSVQGEGIDVDPQITLSQGSNWDFGSVAKTIPSTQICEIENTGIDPLTVTSATLATNTAYKIDSLKDSNGNVINLPQIIAVGAKIFLAIKFSPTANTTYNDTLTFVHDGTNEVSPWDIALTGEGRDEISKTFSYTGAADHWTVPAGVTSIIVECKGGEGGTSYPYRAGHVPGKGGKAQATVPVTPGDTIQVYVGGAGGDASSGAAGGTGGFNGGGTGGSIWGNYAGGGGGGASDIRIGGNDLSDRKVVGAGGGGSGYDYSSGDNGGNGGGLTGQDGAAGGSIGHSKAGKGGTQTAGGAAGGPYGSYGSGDPGTLGNGGKGGGGGSGAGGAGYYGGGGSIWAGGGGGSSYYDAPGNTNKSTTDGVQAGNGEITFTY